MIDVTQSKGYVNDTLILSLLIFGFKRTHLGCSNKHGGSQCDAWKILGYCTHKYVEYMQVNCKKSCGVCGK